MFNHRKCVMTWKNVQHCLQTVLRTFLKSAKSLSPNTKKYWCNKMSFKIFRMNTIIKSGHILHLNVIQMKRQAKKVTKSTKRASYCHKQRSRMQHDNNQMQRKHNQVSTHRTLKHVKDNILY